MKIAIVANGLEQLQSVHIEEIHEADLVIAADGGANSCIAYDIEPDILLGDFDSIDSLVLKKHAALKTEIFSHPPRKDSSDLELALDLSIERGASEVSLYGVLGGRWDMSLANILLAGNEKYAKVKISLHGENCIMWILRPKHPHRIAGASGQIVTLLPLAGSVQGVTLNGFEYPLHDHTIQFGSTLGVSNVVMADSASIIYDNGLLLCILSSQQ